MMNRRRFVKNLPMLSAGAASAGASLTTGCASVRYLQARDGDQQLRVSRTDFADFRDVFVQSSQSASPIYLRVGDGGSYSAVAALCTHRGCQPEPEGDRLVCPCHGSEFTFMGGVLKGPAERPLERFEVTTEGDDLVIWLSRLVRPGLKFGGI